MPDKSDPRRPVERSLLSSVLAGLGIVLGICAGIFLLGLAALFVVCSRMTF